jgi:hypothetical protein
MFKILILLFLITPVTTITAQSTSQYSYLKKCYSSDIDVSTNDNENLGSLKVYSISGKPGVSITYFDVTKDKSSFSKSEIVNLISGKHIAEYVKFSDVILNRSFQLGDVVFTEVRLLCHWKESDSYLHAIFLYDGISLYKVSCFRTTNNIVFFDKLTNAIKLKKCPQDL